MMMSMARSHWQAPTSKFSSIYSKSSESYCLHVHFGRISVHDTQLAVIADTSIQSALASDSKTTGTGIPIILNHTTKDSDNIIYNPSILAQVWNWDFLPAVN
jgi:hypothetical protein